MMMMLMMLFFAVVLRVSRIKIAEGIPHEVRPGPLGQHLCQVWEGHGDVGQVPCHRVVHDTKKTPQGQESRLSCAPGSSETRHNATCRRSATSGRPWLFQPAQGPRRRRLLFQPLCRRCACTPRGGERCAPRPTCSPRRRTQALGAG